MSLSLSLSNIQDNGSNVPVHNGHYYVKSQDFVINGTYTYTGLEDFVRIRLRGSDDTLYGESLLAELVIEPSGTWSLNLQYDDLTEGLHELKINDDALFENTYLTFHVVMDLTSPVITLLGDNPTTITVGSIYEDAGATANDTYDGNITANISVSGVSDVNTSSTGSFTITYNVSDRALNAATEVTRTVNVEAAAGGGGDPFIVPLLS